MKKNYPQKTINGRKDRLHRHIMEECVGRRLNSYEKVYHKDGNPLNNEIENLVLVTFKSSNERF